MVEDEINYIKAIFGASSYQFGQVKSIVFKKLKGEKKNMNFQMLIA